MTAVDEVRIQDTAAEQAVLGAILTAPQRMGEVHLTPADFFRPQHGAIFAAMLALYEQGKTPDPLLVAAELGTKLGPVGPYLQQCMASTPAPGSVGYYAEIVRAKAVDRELLALSERIAQLSRADLPSAEKLSDADTALRRIGGPSTQDGRWFGDLFTELVEDLQNPTVTAPGVPTGWMDVDDLLAPMLPGQVTVIAGRPGSGKSIMGLDIARNCALRLGRLCGVASMEMSSRQLTQRAVSAETGIPLSSLLRRDLSEHDWETMARSAGLRDGKLLILEGPQSVASLKSWVRRNKPVLLIVDYLQLMTGGRRTENRQQEVSEMMRGLKLLATGEQVPLVVLAQLNRAPDLRTGGRPHLSDLRESGGIEQDADNVILLYRPEMYDPLNRSGEVDVILAKQRSGPTGTVVLTAQTAFATFRDYARRTGW